MDLRQIEVIDFSNSGLSGTISDGLRRSKSLRFLELSRAGVSGTVPRLTRDYPRPTRDYPRPGRETASRAHGASLSRDASRRAHDTPSRHAPVQVPSFLNSLSLDGPGASCRLDSPTRPRVPLTRPMTRP